MRTSYIIMIISLLLILGSCNQQKSDFLIVTQTTSNNTFNIVMNGKEAALTLFHGESSGINEDIYSVKGVFTNTQSHTSTIVGFFDGDLVLYEFNDSALKESFSNFQNIDSYEKLNKLKSLIDFEHKIVLKKNIRKIDGIWTNGKDTAEILMKNIPLDVLQKPEILVYESDGGQKLFNLRQVCFPSKNFEIISDYKTDRNHRLLLKYKYPSTPNMFSICEDMNEEGFIILMFDLHGQMVDFQQHPINDCAKKITYKQLISESKDTLRFELQYGKQVKNLKVNTKVIRFIQE